MELRDDLRKEIEGKLRTLSESIKNAFKTDNYEYFAMENIHKTYIDFGKELKSLNCFSDLPINLRIKFPTILFKTKRQAPSQDKLFSAPPEKNIPYEQAIKEMLEDININLELIEFTLNESKNPSSSEYKNKLIEEIFEQDKRIKLRRGIRCTLKIIFTLIMLFVFSSLLFVKTDVKFLFRKSEVGHAFSMLFDLNDFSFNISDEDKSFCSIYWNEKLIYKNGRPLEVNIFRARHYYGYNLITVKMADNAKDFYFYKENDWDYNKFKFKISDGHVAFWLDGELQIGKKGKHL